MKNVEQLNQYFTNLQISKEERNNTILTKPEGISVFNKSFQNATTFDSGKAIPILVQSCYPGDIYKIDTNCLIRLSAQASTPFMSINYDLNFFFVPFNQIDKEFKQLMGENNNYGYSDTTINFPTIEFDSEFKYNENDLGSYMGIPLNVDMSKAIDKINIYRFLAYIKIINDWYRDQNLQSCIDMTSVFNNDRNLKVSQATSKMDSYLTSLIYGKGLAPVSKLPSYFTSCLPYRQKGLPITIPLGTAAPINNNDSKTNLFSPKWYLDNGDNFNNNTLGGSSNGTFDRGINGSVGVGANLSLIADLTKATSATINDLRTSIVSQHLLENFALCGSRYVEQLKSIWGIEINPKNIDRTELIGGINKTLEYTNVVQTSQTTSTSQLGNISSNLFNGFNNGVIEYASEQHGYIIGILVLRTSINNGGQGLPKEFAYKDFLDLFNPLFNGIGEQPVLNQELYLSENKQKNLETFGFNEPFLDTKYNLDTCSGFFSMNSKTSLFPKFLFGEKYSKTPLLSSDWIVYDSNIIGNTLYNVSDSTKEFYHQFIALFNFSIEYSTKQPLYNSPKVYGI